jgi:hypothetical protein
MVGGLAGVGMIVGPLPGVRILVDEHCIGRLSGRLTCRLPGVLRENRRRSGKQRQGQQEHAGRQDAVRHS